MSLCFRPPNSLASWKLRICCAHHETLDVFWGRYAAQNEEKQSPKPHWNCGERSSVKRERKRVAIFQPEFREDLRFWVKTERSTAIRVLDLIEAVMRDPFEGPGKPEPLRYVLAGCWSRRVTQEHRLVYRVTDEAIDFLQARYHY